MAVNLPAFREWAETVREQLPPEHEAYDRADSGLFLLHFSLDSVDAHRLVLPMTDPRHQAHDMLTELLLRWGRVAG